MNNTFLRMVKLLKKRPYLYVIGMLGLTLAGTGRQILLALVLQKIFDTIQGGTLSELLTVTLGGLGILAMTSILHPYFAGLMEKSAIQVIADLRKELYQKIVHLPISYVRNEHSGEIISKMTNDLKAIELSFTRGINHLFYLSFCFIAVICVMFTLDFWLAIVALITAGISFMINVAFADPLKEAGRKVQNQLGLLTGNLSDLLAGISVIKTFNLYQKISGRFKDSNQGVYEASIERVKINAGLDSLNDFGKMIDIIGMMGVGAYLILKGQVSIGIVIAMWQLKSPILSIFNVLGKLMTTTQTSIAAAERIFALLDEEEEPLVYEHLQMSSESLDLAVQVEKVNFGYQSDDPILKNLCFEVTKGSKVALVGPSGGGKSTIFKILLGFYPPDDGEVAIDGSSFVNTELTYLREKIAYVPQNAYLFSGTVKENICYGKVDVTEEEMIAAAKSANAHDFILQLENGYDTIVGERGAHLSGGQRQRIVIARAILKDAPILLLDEATSALDTEAEYLVQEALSHLAEGRTTLTIAHRFSTIQDVDEILVIDDGMVKERGTHEELMKIPHGIYRLLYEKQYQLLNVS